MLTYIVVLVASYLLGSIPTGLLMGKAVRGIDIRRYGSGNTGATNALRVLGPKASAAVLVGDFFKGMLPVVAVAAFTDVEVLKILAALGALAGHNWSIYMGFRGGRGVATGLGGFILLSPWLATIIIALGVAVMVASRYVSLGSIIGTSLVMIVTALLFLLGNISSPHFTYVVIGTSMILFKHRGNLERLLKGREHKLGDQI